MNILAIVSARAIAQIETFELNPKGLIFLPDFVRAIIEEFQFQKFPKTIEEIDEAKGIEFAVGKFKELSIKRFSIFPKATVVETRSSTDDSKKILHEILTWASSKFHANYKSGMIKKWLYVSSLTFKSDILLMDTIGGALSNLSGNVSSAIEEAIGENLEYRPAAINLTHDLLVRKYPLAPFTIQRRAETPFSENKYFSEAPLPTNSHIAILEKLEQDIVN